MEYIVWGDPSLGEYLDPAPYLNTLAELGDQLPAGARGFALDPDHYDFSSERCVKDLRLRAVEFRDDSEELWLQLSFFFNDTDPNQLTVTYEGLVSFVLQRKTRNPIGPTRLGDLLLDEIVPSEHGIRHEWEHHGGTMEVQARDLEAVWSR